MKYLLIPMFLLALMIGCRNTDQTPEGYVEHCYGGDWRQNMVGLTPEYSAAVDIDRSSWPRLTQLLKNFAASEELMFFDTSEESESLSMLYVSACSEHGVWIHADKRTWRVGSDDAHSPLPLMVEVFVYDEPNRWKGISERLDSLLRSEWEGKVDTDHGISGSLKNSLL